MTSHFENLIEPNVVDPMLRRVLKTNPAFRGSRASKGPEPSILMALGPTINGYLLCTKPRLLQPPVIGIGAEPACYPSFEVS